MSTCQEGVGLAHPNTNGDVSSRALLGASYWGCSSAIF